MKSKNSHIDRETHLLTITLILATWLFAIFGFLIGADTPTLLVKAFVILIGLSLLTLSIHLIHYREHNAEGLYRVIERLTIPLNPGTRFVVRAWAIGSWVIMGLFGVVLIIVGIII